MSRIYIPSKGAADWQRLLAQPEKHWQPYFSAMTIANCWESNPGSLPSEISALLSTGDHEALKASELLLAIPEYRVKLPGGQRATQTDVFALLRGKGGLIACAIEGKVDEEFGPTVEAKRRKGAAERLEYLHALLQIKPESSGSLRYQLFHRTAAAILLAKAYCAPVAVLVVQSFSPARRWYSDFEAFGRALGVNTKSGKLADVGTRGGVQLLIGWTNGDQCFRADVSQKAPNPQRKVLRHRTV